MAKDQKGTQSYNVTDLEVSSVVVYPEMAEVSRTWKCALLKGVNNITVENLTQMCDKDSIRVDGRGSAIILEVQYQEKYKKRDEIDEQDIKKSDREFSEKIKELEKEKQRLEAEQKRVGRRREVIDGIASNLMIGGQDPDGKSQGHALSSIKPDDVKNLVSFMATHQQQLAECDDRKSEITDLLSSLVEQIQALRGEHQAKIRDKNNRFLNRQVMVKLDCDGDCDTELTLIYQVNRASWLPKYDIRANSSSKRVQVIYHAIVTQNTGEDWRDTSLFLSTARPSPVKELPKLPTIKVDYKIDPVHYAPRMMAMSMPKKSVRRSNRGLQSAGLEMDDEILLQSDYASEAPPLEVATAQVSTGVLSATYEIPQKTTVFDGRTEHKVTVAEIDLEAVYEHKCIPKVTAKALLTAKLTNVSQYLLLPGSSSIFLDNCFVTDTHLQSVSPNEEFTCLLGMDEAVKIEYKPKEKCKEKAGLINRVEIEKYKQLIVIKNTKPIAIKIQVQEQLPLSKNEQIKVNVTAPSLPKDSTAVDQETAPVSLNSSNNIIWNLEVKAGKKEDVRLNYSVEKPNNSKELEYSEL